MLVRNKEVKVDKKLFKRENVVVSDLDVENRTMTITFASRVPYLRGFGYEVIDTKKMDFTRLNSHACVLFNHDVADYIGVVEEAFYDEKTEKCLAKIRFDTHPKAEQVFNSVKNGILRGVSFGYEITKMIYIGEKDGIEVYEVEVAPFEVTFCPIPADINVGVGRSKEELVSIRVMSKRSESREKLINILRKGNKK